MKRRIYLTLERARDIALRNLLRKVFMAGGFEETKEANSAPVRRTRVPVAEFQAAICMESGGEMVDTDEVECLLANMIYKVSCIAPSVLPEIAAGGVSAVIGLSLGPIPCPGHLISSEALTEVPLTGLDEGLHCARERHSRPVEKGCISGDGSLGLRERRKLGWEKGRRSGLGETCFITETKGSICRTLEVPSACAGDHRPLEVERVSSRAEMGLQQQNGLLLFIEFCTRIVSLPIVKAIPCCRPCASSPFFFSLNFLLGCKTSCKLFSVFSNQASLVPNYVKMRHP